MKKILYLGTDPTHCDRPGHLTHYPLIKIIPRPIDLPEITSAYDNLSHYTHLLFTSKHAVYIFFDHLLQLHKNLSQQHIIAIGSITAQALISRGCRVDHTSHEETQEGLISLINTLDLHLSYFFMPRSSLSRPVLAQFFAHKQIRFCACDIYDTITQHIPPLPDIDSFDEIVFTSPSTVRGFLEIFGHLPPQEKIIAIGPITKKALEEPILF